LTAIWPLVITLGAPLAIHLSPPVGKGVLVLPAAVTEDDFAETASILEAVDWRITDQVIGMTESGDQVIELAGTPTDVITAEAIAGADEQLLTLAGLM
jgi:hypothetical protein